MGGPRDLAIKGIQIIQVENPTPYVFSYEACASYIGNLNESNVFGYLHSFA